MTKIPPRGLPAGFMGPFQTAVTQWLLDCFGWTIANDKRERNHRFLEEALETVQAGGCSREEAHELVDYVFNRPVGELPQEVGGAYVTLAALCFANNIHLGKAGNDELARAWKNIDKIRAKQASKPKFGALPSIELTKSARFTLEWLAKEDSSLYGECRGQPLDDLIRYGFAHFLSTATSDRKPSNWDRVAVTDAGRAWLKANPQ